ncbi:Aldehyde dehydrogenase, conserved site [Penicillium camemberti]|uniref:Aldehyde dehydrogenase, conserved site n=1 Tax=Penicillium camemberti (strain FM 013) TaxID=1429867 RepID=A0A0G4PBI2_PENC3|nr:Aldehyde dehydrogenase, conserved site [Penicillium camemberti]
MTISISSSVHAWRSLPDALSPSLETLSHTLNQDPQWQAFINTEGIQHSVTIGVQSTSSDQVILVSVEPGPKTIVTTGPSSNADFVLVAQAEHWEKFFSAKPSAPFTSFVGIQGMNIVQDGAGVHGNHTKYSQFVHLSDRLLELLREGLHGPHVEDLQPDTDEDHIVGKYVYIYPPVWGKTKVFYERSGTGSQEILFLHTAGSDSRQYHTVMNDPTMRSKCSMIAFDLPAHGRSFPGKTHLPGNHTNTEDAYVGAIREIIQVLKLNKPIVCGASMAGQVCIAVAIRAEEVGAGGTIPLQGCDYLTMKRQFDDKSPVVNQSLFNPNWIYGMMAPNAPLVNKQLVWHTYSAQAYGIFHGDLDFYFGGFDARDRVSSIDVKKCPIYFLTGEFDWSTTPEMSCATAAKIDGAMFKEMEGLGHFPATESPSRFIPYLLEAIEWIQKTRA